MITEQSTGVSAVIDLSVNDRAVNYKSIVMMTLELTENMHDYLCIHMAGIPPRAIKDYYNGPVQLRLSYGARYTQTFYGLVQDVEPLSKTRDGFTNSSPFQEVKLHVFGLSYRMRSERSRSWDMTSLPQMARELADTYGFSLDVPKLPIIYRRFVQEGESDWKALVRFTEMHGLRVNVHGTHMHIYDPSKAFSRNTSYHKLRTVDPYGPKNSPGKVMKFKGHFGKSVKDGSFYDSVVPVLQEDGTYYDLAASEVTGKSGATLTQRHTEAVDTIAEARNILLRDINSDYDYTAEVTCLGLAGCVPGGIVDVDKYRGGFDGNWYVRSVRHTVHTNAFITELDIARDEESNLSVKPVTSFTPPPLPEYRNGRWEARKKLVREYA